MSDSKKKVYAEMEEMFGFVPSFFKSIPDDSIELEWALMKKVQFEDGNIPHKYRELMGIGIAAATKCRYCTLFHTEMAKLHGATDAEIEEAIHYTKSSAGWSAYINGIQEDYDTFRDEITRACEYVRAKMARKAA